MTSPEVTVAPRAKGISAAKQTLLDEERNLLQQLTDLRETIAFMEAKERQQGLILPAVKPAEYKGLSAAKAIAVYLRARRGTKVPLSVAVNDLIDGGVDPGRSRGKQNDPVALVAHNLRIGIPNIPRIVDFSPKQNSLKGKPVMPRDMPNDNILVWLAATADEPTRRKRPKTLRST